MGPKNCVVVDGAEDGGGFIKGRTDPRDPRDDWVFSTSKDVSIGSLFSRLRYNTYAVVRHAAYMSTVHG